MHLTAQHNRAKSNAPWPTTQHKKHNLRKQKTRQWQVKINWNGIANGALHDTEHRLYQHVFTLKRHTVVQYTHTFNMHPGAHGKHNSNVFRSLSQNFAQIRQQMLKICTETPLCPYVTSTTVTSVQLHQAETSYITFNHNLSQNAEHTRINSFMPLNYDCHFWHYVTDKWTGAASTHIHDKHSASTCILSRVTTNYFQKYTGTIQ